MSVLTLGYKESGCCLAHPLLLSGLLSAMKPIAMLWAALQKEGQWNWGKELRKTSNQQAWRN